MERGRVPLSALAAVARPPVLVHSTGRVGILVLRHRLRRHRQESSTFVGNALRALSATRVCENQTHDDLRAHHPGHDPADLMVNVVLIEIWGLTVVDDSHKDANTINQQEKELSGQCVSRFGNAEHDT